MRPLAPLLPFAVAVLAGVLLSRAGVHVSFWTAVVAACAAVGLSMLHARGALAIALCAAAALGAARERLARPAEPDGVERRWEACLEEGRVSEDGRTWSGLARAAPADGGGGTIRVRLRLPLASRAPPPIAARVRLRGRVVMADPPLNPGEADARRRDADRGITGILRGSEGWIEVGRCREAPGAAALRAWRERHRARVEAELPAREAALAVALVLGRGDAVDPADAEAFRRTGTVHVLSVSGMHLAVVVAWAYDALRMLLLRMLPAWAAVVDVRPRAAAAGLVAAGAYAVFAGFGTPVLRALVVTVATLAAYGSATRSEAWNAMAAGAIAILLGDPGAVGSPSFALTFLAVTGFLSLGPPPIAGVAFGGWKVAAWTTIGASLGTSAAVAAWFGAVPALGLLANLVAIPVFGLALLPLLAAAALEPFSPAAAAGLVVLAGPLLAFGRLVVTAVAATPLSSIAIACSGVAAVLAGATIFSLMLLRGTARVVVAGACASVAIALVIPAGRPPSSLEVTFLSVGQGDAAVARLPDGTVIVVDAGPPGAGRRVVVPFLRRHGISRIDVLAISHAHPDHTGGVEEIAEALDVREVWFAGPIGPDPDFARGLRALARRGARIAFVGAGDEPRSFGSVRVEIAGPPARRTAEGVRERRLRNDRSLVLRLVEGRFDVLFTGDLEAEGEESLLASGASAAADIVKIAHHGSRTSSAPRFVDATGARLAVASVGLHNRWSFPAEEVVERWERAGAKVLRTDEDGAVTVRACGGSVCVRMFASKRSRAASWGRHLMDTPGAGAVLSTSVDRRGRILVVDDDGFSRTLYGDMLAEAGHEVVLSAGGPDALEVLRKQSFDAVVSDLVMPEVTGLQILEEAQALAKPVDVIIVTGHATVRNAVTALRSGAFDYITKPVDPDELKLSVQRLLSQRNLLEENRELRSYVGLFRRCQAVASCLDREQICRLAVEGLVEELGGVSGVFLEAAGKGKDPEERAPRGIQGKVHRALAQVLGGDPLAFGAVQTLDAKAGAAIATHAKLPSPVGPSMLIPVRAGSENYGALFVGRAPSGAPFGLMDLGKADFFGKQIGLALDNASKYDEAKTLAYVDDLTELYNVRYLNFILDKEIKRAKRYHQPLSVLFMDLDYFKGVNDRHGHLTGSKLLIEVAAVIKRCVRDTDVLVRYGGDEYTILLPSTDSEGAMVVAERIRASVSETEFRGDGGAIVKMTASIGVACYPEHAREKRDILRMADAAMYHGKTSGRNKVYLASALLDPSANPTAAAAREEHAAENRERRSRR